MDVCVCEGEEGYVDGNEEGSGCGRCGVGCGGCGGVVVVEVCERGK